jgi:hypothetical protein
MATEEKVYLLAVSVDYYNDQLTHLLGNEQISEAIQLLHFLTNCELEDMQQMGVWMQLKEVLEAEFPQFVREHEPLDEEQMRRQLALQKAEQDITYVDQMAELFLQGGEAQAYALEQMRLLDYEKLNETLLKWLYEAEREPVMQWIVLQTLKMQGYSEPIKMIKNEYAVIVHPEAIPTEEEDYPLAWRQIGGIASEIASQTDATLAPMIGQVWMHVFIQQYATSWFEEWIEQLIKNPMLWACALHIRVAQLVMDDVDIDVEALFDLYQLEDVTDEEVAETMEMMKTLK